MSINDIKNKIIPILRRNSISRAAVFGSYARGEERKDSDIDILIEYKNGHDKSLLDFIGLKLALEEKLNKKVDLVEYEALRPQIRRRVLNEQLKIL